MNAKTLGISSALLAPFCCVGPALLTLLGLGSVGFGALIGRYHWWLLAASIGLLAFAWWVSLKERRRCRAARCQMAPGKTTIAVLVVASAIVAFFVVTNLSILCG